jgi:glycosyltransferase involved in cell wall biosynthesis
VEVIARLARLDPSRYVVAQPPSLGRGRLLAQAWEQAVLPVRAARLRSPAIFSPANLAPVGWPRNVVVVHDAAVLREPDAYSRAYRAWHRTTGLAAARRALAVITPSQFSRSELISVAGLAPERVTVIPGGVDERFSPHGPPPERRLGLENPYVLTVATADARKNLAALAPVASELARRGVDLVWAGEARPYFRQIATSGGVKALGYVPDQDLPALYRGARAFVLPSRYEGFGLTCVEAMASGTPVVAADRGALPETCADAAMLVDPDDGAALTEAVLQAISEPGDGLRAAGLRRARALTWEATSVRVHELLAQVVANPG